MNTSTLLCLFLCALLTISQQKVYHKRNHHQGHEIQHNMRPQGYISFDINRLAASWERALREAQNDESTLVHSHHNKHSHRGARRHVLPNGGGKKDTSKDSSSPPKNYFLKTFDAPETQRITSPMVGTRNIQQQAGLKGYMFSLFSQAAYYAPWNIRAGVGVVNFFRLKTPDYPLVTNELKGYELVKASTTHYAVADHQKKTLVVAFRGTLPYSPFDLFNDMMIAMNMRPYRWMRGYLFTKWMMYKHPGYKTYLTGHSLGGTIAETVGEALDGKAEVISFNPGQCPFTDKKKTYPYIQAYKVEGDIISECKSMAGEVITLPKGNRGPLQRHGIKAFEEYYESGNLKNLKNDKI